MGGNIGHGRRIEPETIRRFKLNPLGQRTVDAGPSVSDSEDRISFLPAVPVEELPALLRRADVGLVPNLPSAASYLMLPVKLTEYAALGIPVIAARLRTVEHYFGGGAVRLFEPGNPHSLAQAIEELYKDRSRGVELALRASQVLRSIGWELQRRAFFDAIDSVV